MGLETGTYISDLNANNPVNATDVVGEGDDHLRLIKSTLLNTFPNVTGAVTLTHTQLNNAAIKTEANVFTAAQRIDNVTPRIIFDETDAVATTRMWDIAATGQSLRVRVRTDADGSSYDVSRWNRNGLTISSVVHYVGAQETAIEATANAGVDLYYDNGLRFSSTNNGCKLNASAATSTPPVSSDAPNTRIQFYDSGSNLLSQIGHAGGSTLQVSSFIHGGAINLTGEDASGVERILVAGSPDGQTTLYYAGTATARTTALGIASRGTLTNTPESGGNQDARVLLENGSGSAIGDINYRSSGAMYIRNFVHGGGIEINGETAAGTANTRMITADPDGDTTLYYAGTGTVRTTANGIELSDASGSPSMTFRSTNFGVRRGYQIWGGTGFTQRYEIHGGLQSFQGEDSGGVVRNLLVLDPDAGQLLYWGGQENFRSSSEAASTIGMGAEVRHNDDSFYPVGMNVIPKENTLASGNVTLSQANVGKNLYYNSATARSILANSDGNIKAGATWTVMVGPSAGTCTLDGGTGVQIVYWNGSTWSTTAAAANLTLGQGQYTIWKDNDALYWCSGPNIT